MAPSDPAARPNPLSNIRVVEIPAGTAVAYCTKLLAECGAEVICVEPPGGSALRREGPFRDDVPDIDGGGRHLLLDAGKRSVMLDASSAEDRAALERLVASADLLVTSWKAESSLPLRDEARMRELFPDTTYVSISEFGRTGPYAEDGADSHIIEALAGMSYVSGDPDREPLSSGVEVADYFAGVYGWVSALAALREAAAGTRAHFVDVSMHETLTLTDDHALSIYTSASAVRKRYYSRILPGYPSDVMPCQDGYIAFVTAGPGGRNWAQTVSRLIDRPELASDPLFADVHYRVFNWPQFDEIVNPWLASHTAEEIFRRSGELLLGFAKVGTARSLLADEHLRARSFWQQTPDGMTLPGPPVRLSDTPLHVAPASSLGADNESVLGEARPPRPASPSSTSASSGRLRSFEGLRVVELARGWTSALVGRVMSDLGAEVIKLEAGRLPPAEVGPTYFTVRQAGKQSVSLDLGAPGGRDLLFKILETADVMVDSYMPRVTEKFGIRYADLKERFPRLIVVSITGYGQDGPYRDRAALGMTIEPAAGPASVTGYPGGPPMKTGQTWCDPFTGLHATGALLTALISREQTGRGQHIDAAMLEAVVQTLDGRLADEVLNGRLHQPDGNRRPGQVRGAYPCAGVDDWVAISIRDEDEWQRFCRASGNEAWLQEPRYADGGVRYLAHDELDRRIADWTRGQSKFEVARLLRAAGVPAAPVMKADEVLADEQLAAREFFDPLEVYDLGVVPIQRYFPPRFDGRGFPAKGRAARLGEHTDEVLRGMGFDEAAAAEVREQCGMFGGPPELWRSADWDLRIALYDRYRQLGSILRIDDLEGAALSR